VASRSDERTKRLDGEKSRSSSDQRAASREGFPRAFGGYMLLGAFGKGGMGEVYLARRGGIEGIEKLCVLKLLRADLASEKEYVGRFLDEARVVISLQHANICPVFDVGRVQDALYLAMEYLHGVNLRHVTDRLLERERKLEPEIAVHIVASTLAALHHAHRHEDPATGEPLHVVHRDVSPHNVMITFQGEVKLIDFGLAASTVKKEETESQLVMGKVAYMSPEQARGEPVDARTDQFATAILLYELLLGERFYGNRKTHEIWQVVGPGGYLPEHLDRVDESLRPILLRALADQPDARFASCEDLREELLGWLARRAPTRTERALRELMQDVFQDDIEAQRAMAQRLLSHDDDDGDPTFSSGATILSNLAKGDRAAALPRDVDEGATVGSSIENVVGPPANDRKTPSRASHPSSKASPASGRSGGRPARSEHDSSTEATLSSTKLPLPVPPKQRPPAMAALIGVAVVGALLFVGSGVLGPREATPDIAVARTSTSTSTTAAPAAAVDDATPPSNVVDPAAPGAEIVPSTTTTTADPSTSPPNSPDPANPSNESTGAAVEAVVDAAADPSEAPATGEAPRGTKPTSRTTPRPRPPVTGPVAMPVVAPPVAPPAPVVELPPPSTTATTPPPAPSTPAATEAPPATTTTTPKGTPPPDVAAIYARIERCKAECAKTVLRGASLAEIQADPARLQAFLMVANNCLPRCPK